MREPHTPKSSFQQAASDTQNPPVNYKTKALEAALYIVFGFGLSQIIRLGGNIVLTRLLAPELFGLVTLARVFIIGLTLFSDFGLEPAIIRSSRSHDSHFLNTAWTLQIIRSALLALISIIIAIPVALFYKQPVLMAVIPVIGLFSMISGFQSTSLSLLRRDLQQSKMIFMEISIQIISLGCTVLAAYKFRTIWALLSGELIGSTLRVLWSHALNRGQPNRFEMEKEATHELISFGKWILVSTAMMFLAAQADRLLLGKLFTMTGLGVYTIAATLAEIPKQVTQQLSGKVIYPLITKYAHLSRSDLRLKIIGPRGKMLLLLIIPLALFASFGDFVIYSLYDERYAAAAWIFPMLAIGMWPFLLTTSINSTLYVIAKPKYMASANFTKFLYMAILIPVAYRLGGEPGVILVIVLNDLPSYIVINYGLYREKLSMLKQDALMTIILVCITALLIAIRLVIGIGFPGQEAFLTAVS